MSELPSTWETPTIGDLCSLINGRAFKPTDWTPNGIPIVRIQNLNNPEAPFNRFDGEVRPQFLIDNGQLLFAWSGTPGTSFGAHIWYGGPAVLNQHIFRVEFDESLIDKSYLRFAINQRLDELIDKAHGGVGLRHVTKGRFEETEIALPPLAEQRRIVAKLDALTARTARARADLDRVPALASRYRSAILTAAFSGNLTAQWRMTNSDQCDAAEVIEKARRSAWMQLPRRKEKYQPGVRPNWRPHRELPATWRWVSVDEIVHLVQYGTSAKTRDQGDVPVLRMGNILDGSLDMARLKYLPAGHEEFPELLLDDGDILFNRTNSAELVGKSAVYRGPSGSTSFASYLIRLKSFGAYLPELLAAYINSPFGREWVAASTSQQVGQANVNGSKLRGLGIPMMPVAEQRHIGDLVKAAFAEIDRVVAEAAAARRLLDRLDQAILAKAFRGELVPQNPADEPASVLLQRIRAERAAAPVKRGRRSKAA